HQNHVRDRDRGEDPQDDEHDHELDQGETAARAKTHGGDRILTRGSVMVGRPANGGRVAGPPFRLANHACPVPWGWSLDRVWGGWSVGGVGGAWRGGTIPAGEVERRPAERASCTIGDRRPRPVSRYATRRAAPSEAAVRCAVGRS